MPLRQIERLRIPPKRDRDVFRSPPKLSLRRLPLLLLNVFQIYFAHEIGGQCVSMNDRERVIKLVVLERINEFIVVAESIADRSPNNVGFARARVSMNDQD